MTELKYAAFISYCHNDKKLARWLHKRLENYVVPKPLQSRQTPIGILGNRLGKVFLDEAEFGSSSDLSGSIKQALSESATLLVICSRAATNSDWVAKEIREFENIHGRDRIFCFIVDGRPATAKRGLPADMECFPAPLLSGPEPLAADARGGRAHRVDATNRLVAGLLDVGFDELRQRELARRNRRLLIATGVSTAAAVAAIALTVFAIAARNEANEQRLIAELEVSRTQRVLEFILESFQSADPYKSNGLEITAAEILERSRTRIDAELDEDPEIRRTMRDTMSMVYKRLGAYDTAEPLLRSNLAELDPAANADEYHKNAGNLATILVEKGEYAEAEALLRAEIDHLRASGQLDVGAANSINDLGRVLKDSGMLDESEALLRESIALFEEFGTDPDGTMVAYNNLGVLLQQNGRPDEAREFLDKTLKIRVEFFGSEHPYTARAENNLGTLLLSQGEVDEARIYHERALEKRRAAFGDKHAEVAESTYNVGLVYMELGQYDVALEYINSALEMDRDDLGDEHPAVAYDYFALARVHASAGDWVAAGPALERAVKIRDAKLQPEHQLARSTRLYEAAYQLVHGSAEEAAEIAAELQALFDGMGQSDVPARHLADGIRLLAESGANDVDKVQLRLIIDALENAERRVEKSIETILVSKCREIAC